MQRYAGVYLLQNYSTCFGCLSHSSSGVHQTVTAASGTGHSVRATTYRQFGLNVVQCTHDVAGRLAGNILMMGARDTRNM